MAENVALVHDWLVAQRGGEAVLLALAEMFPKAPIFTLCVDRARIDPRLAERTIVSSWIQKLPGAPKRFRAYLPLFPRAIEHFDLSAFDLVVSTSHCVAKGVLTATGQKHVSYVHTPMRYAWDQQEHYVSSYPLLRPVLNTMLSRLRRWDVRSASRPTTVVANSRFVSERIAKVWGRAAQVVFPPVDVEFYSQGPECPREGYVVVCSLVPYKRVDLAVAAATERNLPLTVVGDGPLLERLQADAGPSVRFVSHLSREALRQVYKSSRGLLFCGVEDFGIAPVEAMAAGCPVVAFAEGGVCESVVGLQAGSEATGVFFRESTVPSLLHAIDALEAHWQGGGFGAEAFARRVAAFTKARFVREMAAICSLGVGQPATGQSV